MDMVIKNGNILCDGKLIHKDLCIRNGKIIDGSLISGNYNVMDALGFKIFPGIIDVHNDSIERLIVPMRKNLFLYENVIHEMIMRNFCNGITCFYFSLSVSTEPGIRSVECYNQLVHLIAKIRKHPLYKDNVKVQLRYEITKDAKECIDDVNFSNIDMVCLNDHSPNGIMGWSEDKFIRNVNYRCALSESEMKELVCATKKGQIVEYETVQHVLAKTKEYAIPIGVHDISSFSQMNNLGIVDIDFAEFPLNREICTYFTNKGIPVILGAPNILNGKSQNGNISSRDAIADGICNILCSDYLHSSLLLSVYLLDKLKIKSLPEAWRMITENPAKAFGLTEKGSLKVSSDADFIILDDSYREPQIVATFVKGVPVYCNSFYSKLFNNRIENNSSKEFFNV